MKSQSQLVLTLKHQIVATLKLIALKIKRYVLQLLELEQKLEEATKTQLSNFEMLKPFGNVWEGFGKKRIYFDIPTLLEVNSKNQIRKYMQSKFYFDDATQKFCGLTLSDSEFEICLTKVKQYLEC